MSDGLRKAIRRVGQAYDYGTLTDGAGVPTVLAAARRFLALTETGPDYEAGLRKVLSWLTYLEDTDTPRDVGKLYAMTVEAIDAALADYLTEET